MKSELDPAIVQTAMMLGRAVRTKSDGLTDEEHIEGLGTMVRSTRMNHEIGETSTAHGIGLARMPLLQVAYVGNSPNSEALAAALCEAWNRLVEDAEAWVSQQDMIETRRNEQRLEEGTKQ